MIDTTIYALGFISYTFFCVYAFKLYSEHKISNNYGFILIYLYLSILFVYFIFEIDQDNVRIQEIIQSLVYMLGCGIVAYNYAKNLIKKEDKEVELQKLI